MIETVFCIIITIIIVKNIIYQLITLKYDILKLPNPSLIKVYIPEHQNAEIVREALKKWETSTDYKIKFVYSEKAKSNIEIKFVKSLPAGLLGFCYSVHGYKFCSNFKLLVNSYTILLPTHIGSNLITNKKLLFNIAIHEIGHAIGLKHHSSNKESVMSSWNSLQNLCNTHITEEEIIRLEKLYKFNQE